VASRPSSTTGSAHGDGRRPVVARVLYSPPREQSLAAPANDNQRPVGRRLLQLVGPAFLLALMLGGWILFYLF
jgi:hypothetical protein